MSNPHARCAADTPCRGAAEGSDALFTCVDEARACMCGGARLCGGDSVEDGTCGRTGLLDTASARTVRVRACDVWGATTPITIRWIASENACGVRERACGMSARELSGCCRPRRRPRMMMMSVCFSVLAVAWRW